MLSHNVVVSERRANGDSSSRYSSWFSVTGPLLLAQSDLSFMSIFMSTSIVVNHNGPAARGEVGETATVTA